ncbi:MULTISPECIES: NAD(P)H-dependent oxidoreductase subunit E [Rubrivivax]|uniref:Formate dehydrogenase n=1 Tax=Rubrivivax benzoatilyticus TaxID=316997 RepID=A0ABX0HXW6_9BURK|nr:MULTISPECIES: NAD(P)H-dependent oxidoreductase subunit E [Rubrivivax]EGJ12134.1 formate dehydrogenase subunit gamma [Rubrivivax benzoatilyticus JA2 = ATCC BAA-35]MCC9595170.1 NAD(P)H-dependent oxidoreductase subunit E [Rubrivivax sp. JA1055]MCC9648038.1 NAD(P)H-dependent oxidoreductase subunit E [Rubrivivax sp. JA1029]NHK99833.1 formate dehydrogenase [Rubrivivax benzoatilyticus]NHL25706.1 formate dehydrogenase [Rubrivivax benzoatilyticus]
MTQDIVASTIARHQGREGPLLPILHELQHTLGYIPREALPRIAQALNLSRAEVHGVVSYYHHFRTEKPTAPVLQVCRAESCQAMGADRLWDHAQAHGGCQVEAVYCLGLCASSPAAMLGEEPLGRLTPEKLDEVLG